MNHLPRTSKGVYYRQAGLDLVLLDSNGASLTTLASGRWDAAQGGGPALTGH